MANRLVSVDDNFNFPEGVTERQAQRLRDGSSVEGAAVVAGTRATISTQKGVPFGLASLDAGGKVPSALLPSDIGGPARVLPLTEIACYGESTTESVGTNWPVSHLAPYLGVPVVNKGVSGQGAADILLRMGAIEPRVTLQGNRIPASGSVDVTALDPARGWRINGSGSFAATGTLAGVEGSLSHNTSADTWTFTRTAAGAETPVPAGTRFVRKQSLANPHNRTILGTLRNNVSSGDIFTAVDLAMLAPQALQTEVKKLLVWGCINGTNEPKGHERYNLIVRANKRLADYYGENFYDIRRDFINNGLTRAGITPTATDLANIAKDCPPPSLMADTIHPNAAGYEIIARLLAEKALELGWVNSINIPADPGAPVEPDPVDPETPAVVLTSDSFNRADGPLGTTDASAGGTPMAWTPEAQVSIKNERFHVSGQSLNRAARVNIDTANHHIQTRLVNAAASRGCGIIGGGVDTQNYYRVDNAASGVAIYRVTGGTSTAAFGPGPVAADGDMLGLKLGDGTVEVTLNGQVVGSVKAGRELLGGTIAGLRSAWNTETQLDDFIVTAV